MNSPDHASEPSGNSCGSTARQALVNAIAACKANAAELIGGAELLLKNGTPRLVSTTRRERQTVWAKGDRLGSADVRAQRCPPTYPLIRLSACTGASYPQIRRRDRLSREAHCPARLIPFR